MGLYFSPRVLNDVLVHPGRLEPKRLEITVLLTDLRNSTPLAELLATEAMLNLLNKIFTVENAAVFAEDGSMEKPVGNQFLAYWARRTRSQTQPIARCARRLRSLKGCTNCEKRLIPAVKQLFGYGLALHAGD